MILRAIENVRDTPCVAQVQAFLTAGLSCDVLDFFGLQVFGGELCIYDRIPEIHHLPPIYPIYKQFGALESVRNSLYIT